MGETRLPVDEIALRRCTDEDAETLALVGAATFLDAFAGVLPGRSIVEHCKAHHTAENYRQFLAEPTCRIWLAETATQQGPVGYCLITSPNLPIADPQLDDLELKRIYLLSRFHGGGAGRKLMEVALAGARELGGRRLFLGVFAGNARALAFYERLGFKVVGRRRFKVGFDTFDDLILGRNL